MGRGRAPRLRLTTPLAARQIFARTAERGGSVRLRLAIPVKGAAVAVIRVNGVKLSYEMSGAGAPMVFVHGSWGDHHNWDPVAPHLSESFTVVTYDRRGHSRSERPAGQGSIYDDADDLAALIDALALGPAHVVGNSFGSIVNLNAAVRHPEAFATLLVHEPPLLGMLAGTQFEPALQEVNRRIGAVIELLQAGRDEAGAKQFVETVAWHPGAWDQELTREMRDVFTNNAPTFLDEASDPDWQRIDLGRLALFDRPALLTKGTVSPPFFAAIVDAIASALPRFRLERIEGADHSPHLSTTERYIDLVTRFAGAGSPA